MKIQIWLPQLICIIMLLWALNPENPYAYYTLLRWVCCGIFAYLTFQSFEQKKQGWMWLLGITALLYNPIFPVHLNRELWSVVNVVTIGIAATSIYTFNVKKMGNNAPSTAGFTEEEKNNTQSTTRLTEEEKKNHLRLLMCMGKDYMVPECFSEEAQKCLLEIPFTEWSNEVKEELDIWISESWDRDEEDDTEASDAVNKIERDDRFIACDNGTILDTQMNRVWAAKDNGSDINWEDAKYYCENYQGGGYTDWRMPTIVELAELYYQFLYYKPNLSVNVHPKNLICITGTGIWSSTSDDSGARIYNFNDGNNEWEHMARSVYLRALPVRSVK